MKTAKQTDRKVAMTPAEINRLASWIAFCEAPKTTAPIGYHAAQRIVRGTAH